jgi:hypothetical protein
MKTKELRDFAPFPAACVDRGICKTVAYDLLNGGLLDTFKIGRRRYVYLDSLLTIAEKVEAYNELPRNRSGADA